jgi:GNAT superfamily N-acetyltransferase
MLEPFAARLAETADLPYMMGLQRANRESVGGLPAPALQDRIDRGAAFLGLINGDPVSYLLCDKRAKGVLRIPQACVQYDARRREYGKQLVSAAFAYYSPFDEVRLRCAADLEANLFWRSLGFECVGVMQGGTRRGRLINCWQMWLSPGLLGIDSFTVAPAAQIRTDCMYDDSGFIVKQPAGFTTVTELPKMAWSNRKKRGGQG